MSSNVADSFVDRVVHWKTHGGQIYVDISKYSKSRIFQPGSMYLQDQVVLTALSLRGFPQYSLAPCTTSWKILWVMSKWKNDSFNRTLHSLNNCAIPYLSTSQYTNADNLGNDNPALRWLRPALWGADDDIPKGRGYNIAAILEAETLGDYSCYGFQGKVEIELISIDA